MMSPKDFYERIKSIISTYGVYLQGVAAGPDSPTFTYTIGMSPKVGFEIIIVAVPYEYAGAILNHVCRELSMGKKLELDKPDSRWATMPCVFKKVHPANAREFGNQAFNFYEKDDPNAIEFVQMVIPDKDGHFPWEPEYDHIRMIGQNLLYNDPDATKQD